VNAAQAVERLAAHRVRDGGAEVTALGDVAGVAEAVHQLGPRACGAAGAPAELGRLPGEAVARQGRQHQVESVLGGATVGGRVGQRADGLQQFDDGAGPAMRHDQRQRVRVRRTHVDEVDVHPVDLGRELRQRVQPRLHPAQVVVGRPVAGEFLDRRQLHALRAVLDQLPGRPARHGEAAAQVGQRLLRNLHVERTDAGQLLDCGHGLPLDSDAGKSQIGPDQGAHSGRDLGFQDRTQPGRGYRSSGRDEGPVPACRHAESRIALSTHCRVRTPLLVSLNGSLRAIRPTRSEGGVWEIRLPGGDGSE
jgi:hypothetical protein